MPDMIRSCLILQRYSRQRVKFLPSTPMYFIFYILYFIFYILYFIFYILANYCRQLCNSLTLIKRDIGAT